MNARFSTAAVVAAVTAGVVLAPSSAMAAKGFTYGVTAAEVTSNSALVWARPNSAGTYVAHVATDKKFKHQVRAATVKSTTGNDLTIQTKFRGLKPNKTYYYRFTGKGGKVSDTGKLRTAPGSKQKVNVNFAISGDADAQKAAGASTPFFGNFGVYGAMAKMKNFFNINLGDTIYSDSEVPGQEALATTVDQKWAKYKQNLAQKNLQKLRESGSVYNHWDDHEFQNDFSKPEFGNTIYQAGVKAFRNYMPAVYKPSSGLYRTFRWGKNLELFFLDERSFRSAKASANHTCDNPSTGRPDNGPTAPASIRAAFALLDPEFNQPVSAACLAAINDPNRTMLGASQLKKFESAIKKSSATWKVIVNEVPIQQFYALPYDRWEGYAAERTKLITYLQKNVKNAVFLTTDVHANLVNDVHFQTLEPGGVKKSGIEEFTTGPVGTGTFSKEIDNAIGRPGSGSLVTSLFLHPQPPGGVGMQCANTDVFSFGQVSVTSTTFTVKLLDTKRKEVKDVSNSKCGPFKLKAKK